MMRVRFAVSLAVLFASATAAAQDRPPLQPLPGADAPAPAEPTAAPDEKLPPPQAPAWGRRRRAREPEASPPPPVTTPAPAGEPDHVEPVGPPTSQGLRVNLGLKLAYVATSGFDTFASTDALAHVSVDGTYGLFSRGRLTLAAGLGWDAGGRGSKLRGLDASLVSHRFTVPLEARYALTRAIWPLVRVAPGATYLHASVKDPSAPAELADSNWAFAVDASVGAAFVLGGSGTTAKRPPRFVLLPEVGYMVTTAAGLSPTPSRNEDDVIGADGRTRLGDVALSGFFWRLTAGMAF